MKIAFVGPPAVGKDAASNYVAHKYSLIHISSGDIVRGYVQEHDLGSLDRKNLQKVANELRTNQGGDVLVKIAMEKVKNNLVLSGLRAIDEVTTFKKYNGKVVAITAPLERRYELAKLRGRIDDNVSFEAFKKIEDEEATSADKNGQNVNEVIHMADYTISNDGTLEDLFKKCDELVKSL